MMSGSQSSIGEIMKQHFLSNLQEVLLEMKQRFSSLDVKVIAHELSNSLVTLRLANVYDLSSKIFLLKFAKPDDKKQMIIDSGFRCHLTSFSRATAAAPSVFVAKLRKFLKTRRVTSVTQVGTDRIIEFQFSDGQYRLFLEFYASGNIILTDKELNVLTLLRIVAAGEGQEELRGGLKYSLENRQNYGGIPPLTKERLHDALQKAVDKGEDGTFVGKKQKKKPTDALRRALAVSVTEFPPLLVDHAMRVTDFDASLKPGDVLKDDALLDHLMRSLDEAQRVVQEITSREVTKGYIIAKPGKGEPSPLEPGQDTVHQNLMYDDFHPFRPRQFEDDPSCTFLPFEGFNKTVDEFFSSIEGQKLESRLQERELNAKKKLEAARQDQAKRLGGLQEIQELNIRKAGAIEANVERVQEAMDAVNGLIGNGMDWVEIAKLIELEQKRSNPVAGIIKLPLKLQENTITLLLEEEQLIEDDDSEAYETGSDVSDSEDETSLKDSKKKTADTRLVIDINLGETPWSNAREYYDQRRSAASKEQKTLQSSSKALKSTEQKIAHDLKKGLKQEKAILRPVRRQIWFEKFTWFVSSDGYLVLGGRDAQQNEILYKKYLRKGDVYVHADLQGASSIVIRNKLTADSPIPPSTLSQAGTLAVASSSAWDSKAGMSAWWVNADQVSKSASAGDFLPVGNFTIRGTKNFLPPAPLLLGFGVMFHISDDSKAKHVKHRLHDNVEVSGASETEEAQVVDDKVLQAGSDPNNESDYGDDESEDDDTRSNNENEDGSASFRNNPLQADQQRNMDEDDVEAATDSSTNNLERLEINDQSVALDQSVQQSDSASDDEQSETEARTEPEGPPTVSSSVKGSTKGPAPGPRGKRGKAKAKKLAKYKDQDEEDRLAAQTLIGAAAGRDKAEAEAKAKAQHDAELAFQKERRRAQHQRTMQQTAEHEELRRQMLENGVENADDDEAVKMTRLDSFVGTPLAGDEIIEAIPVCAPWAALGRYKYKAKLQPGAQKKGKAIKEILARWVEASNKGKGVVDEESRDVERMWPREVELLRGWKAEECTNCVPVSKVRVMIAGGLTNASAGAGGGASKGKGRSGKGSKKSR